MYDEKSILTNWLLSASRIGAKKKEKKFEEENFFEWVFIDQENKMNFVLFEFDKMRVCKKNAMFNP